MSATTTDRHLAAIQSRNAAAGYPTDELTAQLAAFFLDEARAGRTWTERRAFAQNAGDGWDFIAREGWTARGLHISIGKIQNAITDAADALALERAEARREAAARADAAVIVAQAEYEATRDRYHAEGPALFVAADPAHTTLRDAVTAAWQAAERARATAATFADDSPAQTIQQRRAALGLSQSEFAAALGISVRTLQNWEQGHRTPRLSGMVERAIAALEID